MTTDTSFCKHPYRYSSDTDSECENPEKAQEEDVKKVHDEDVKKVQEEEEEVQDEKAQHKERKLARKARKEAEKTQKKKSHRGETKDPESKKMPIDTDVESDGFDNSCVKMSSQFISTIQKTLQTEKPRVVADTLRKTPLGVVLHYLHFLMYTVRDDEDLFDIMLSYNKKYNIVSRYFLKALRKEDKLKGAMDMLVEVTSEITNKTSLDEIKSLVYFTQEFIAMVTIQSGNMQIYDKITSEWELNERFEKNTDLIASFFGIKRFFSDPTRYNDRRELLISAICGGSVKTLSKIMRKTKSEFLTEYTLRKVRAVCIPNEEMIAYLLSKYDLRFG